MHEFAAMGVSRFPLQEEGIFNRIDTIISISLSKAGEELTVLRKKRLIIKKSVNEQQGQ